MRSIRNDKRARERYLNKVVRQAVQLMLADHIALLDCYQKVMFIAVTGNIAKSRTKADLNKNIYNLEFSPLINIKYTRVL